MENWTNFMKSYDSEKKTRKLVLQGVTMKESIDQKNPKALGDQVTLILHRPNLFIKQKFKIDWNVSSTNLKAAFADVTGGTESRSLHYITSQRFVVLDAAGRSSEWTLLLNPCYIENGVRYLSLYLWMCRLEPPFEHIDVTYSLNILSEEGKTLHTTGMSSIKRFTKYNCTFGWKKFVSRYKLGVEPPEVIRMQGIVNVNSESLITDTPTTEIDSLGSTCTITEPSATDVINHRSDEVGYGCKTEELMDIDIENEAQSFRVYTAYLFRTNMKGWDMKILTGLYTFPVHTDVLKVKSPVFASHFIANANLPKPLKTMDLDWTIDHQIIEGMIEFCYTETTKIFSDYTKTLSLIKAARRYKIEGLEMRCIEAMMTMVTLENYSSVYTLMRAKKIEEGKKYSSAAFLKTLIELRKDHPSVMMDYEKDPELCALLIFGT